MSSLSESSYQTIGQPIGVGIVSTEGEKLLNALRKIQTKLHQKQCRTDPKPDLKITNISRDKTCRVCASGAPNGTDGTADKLNKCTNTYNTTGAEDKASNDLIEKRLKLIENQLKNISIQLMVNNSDKHEMNGYKRVEPMVDNSYDKRCTKAVPKTSMAVSIEEQIRCDDKYETTINQIKQMIKTKDKNSRVKSRSMEAINTRTNPSKHFHLQYRDIPFLLGTNSSKSHSVIANRQIEISRLKQHSQLCTDQMPGRRIFSQTLKTRLLDNEIKELLYDLREEHNYICEEIQLLSKQLETITDPKQRVDFSRELYFLSRRILAKKRQINELQELHSIVTTSGVNTNGSNGRKAMVRQTNGEK